MIAIIAIRLICSQNLGDYGFGQYIPGGTTYQLDMSSRPISPENLPDDPVLLVDDEVYYACFSPQTSRLPTQAYENGAGVVLLPSEFLMKTQLKEGNGSERARSIHTSSRYPPASTMHEYPSSILRPIQTNRDSYFPNYGVPSELRISSHSFEVKGTPRRQSNNHNKKPSIRPVSSLYKNDSHVRRGEQLLRDTSLSNHLIRHQHFHLLHKGVEAIEARFPDDAIWVLLNDSKLIEVSPQTGISIINGIFEFEDDSDPFVDSLWIGYPDIENKSVVSQGFNTHQFDLRSVDIPPEEAEIIASLNVSDPQIGHYISQSFKAGHSVNQKGTNRRSSEVRYFCRIEDYLERKNVSVSANSSLPEIIEIIPHNESFWTFWISVPEICDIDGISPISVSSRAIHNGTKGLIGLHESLSYSEAIQQKPGIFTKIKDAWRKFMVIVFNFPVVHAEEAPPLENTINAEPTAAPPAQRQHHSIRQPRRRYEIGDPLAQNRPHAKGTFQNRRFERQKKRDEKRRKEELDKKKVKEEKENERPVFPPVDPVRWETHTAPLSTQDWTEIDFLDKMDQLNIVWWRGAEGWTYGFVGNMAVRWSGSKYENLGVYSGRAVEMSVRNAAEIYGEKDGPKRKLDILKSHRRYTHSESLHDLVSSTIPAEYTTPYYSFFFTRNSTSLKSFPSHPTSLTSHVVSEVRFYCDRQATVPAITYVDQDRQGHFVWDVMTHKLCEHPKYTPSRPIQHAHSVGVCFPLDTTRTVNSSRLLRRVLRMPKRTNSILTRPRYSLSDLMNVLSKVRAKDDPTDRYNITMTKNEIYLKTVVNGIEMDVGGRIDHNMVMIQ
ncbi:hypothetical protein BLNAU_3604 [Blattamonas nauphoetae]|uniref:Uncharacterized protein n=1 Tax=Blattamonas nauphoetae TaxID=2049346 RepID=A0ABQ9YCI9_9EUKA|nr:hypothetical protein BLNAU_3604 [Blattamonas nauphoetae]